MRDNTDNYLLACYNCIEGQAEEFGRPLEVSLARVKAYLDTIDSKEELVWPSIFHDWEGGVRLVWCSGDIYLFVKLFGASRSYRTAISDPDFAAKYETVKSEALPHFRSLFINEENIMYELSEPGVTYILDEDMPEELKEEYTYYPQFEIWEYDWRGELSV